MDNKPIRCVKCGKYVSYRDIENCDAYRELATPDSDYSIEIYETFCAKCYEDETAEARVELHRQLSNLTYANYVREG